MRGEIQNVPRREAEADRKIVAEVALALAPDRDVHGDHQRLVAELPRALDEAHRHAALAEDVGLEPQAPSRLARDALDRGGRHGRERIRDPGRGGRARNAHVRKRPAEADAAGGPDGDRELCACAENRGRRVDPRDAGEHFRGEPHALECGAVAGELDLVLGRAVEEIEYRARQAPLRHPAQVRDVPSAQDARGGTSRDRAGRGCRGWNSGSRFAKPARRAHSAFTPEARITRAQRSWSFFRNAANSDGVSATVTAPSAFMRSCVSRLASDLRISSARRFTADAGVPAGASMPTQGAVSSKPGRPDCSSVGTAGKSACGLCVPTASTFSFFAETWSAMPTIG